MCYSNHPLPRFKKVDFDDAPNKNWIESKRPGSAVSGSTTTTLKENKSHFHIQPSVSMIFFLMNSNMETFVLLLMCFRVVPSDDAIFLDVFNIAITQPEWPHFHSPSFWHYRFLTVSFSSYFSSLQLGSPISTDKFYWYTWPSLVWKRI